jgi:hypothetical protein
MIQVKEIYTLIRGIDENCLNIWHKLEVSDKAPVLDVLRRTGGGLSEGCQ